MNNNTIVVGAVAVLLFGGIGGYALKSGTMDDRYGEHDGFGIKDRYGNKEGSDKETGERAGMGMMDHSGHDMMAMNVSSEREFIEHMIPHHEEAVTTAKEVLARGATTPAIKSLVEGIVTAQEKEIADMKSWYQTWYGEAYTDKNNYIPMMRDLTKLSGAELDKVFLDDMVMHHMGAIMMAQSVKPHIEHEEMTTLSKAIIDSQTAEINTMRTQRSTLE
jgi:uncharacterized protein (DUF305 family)